MIRLTAALSALLLAATPVVASGGTTPDAAPLIQTVAMQRHAAGTFYLDAALEGYGELRLLVDTGSSYLVIGRAVLEELERNGAARFDREISGRMADNSHRVVPIYRLSRLRLGDSCWISDVEAAVFPSGIRPILGMRILERLAPFTFSAAPAEIGLSRCEALAATAQLAPEKAEAASIPAGEPPQITPLPAAAEPTTDTLAGSAIGG